VAPPSLPSSVTEAVGAAIADAIAAKKLPGCVVVVGRHDSVLLARAYGSRSLLPTVTPMTMDTVFDLASLTKPIATAASVVVLTDKGEIDLDAPLRTYIPELGAQGTGTVRQALTHVAGFVTETRTADYAAPMSEVVRRIGRVPLRSAPGAELRYSDVGFILLGEVVRRVSGKDLAVFVRDEVFTPLGMTETGFLPGPELRARAAPTESVDGHWLQGEVHDPRARQLGGVAGHAGLFATAGDLVRFSQSLLGGGRPFLSPRALQSFAARHDVPRGVRALGWDVASPFSSNRGTSLSPRAFGHGGYTGTSVWIDPEKDMFVLFLSNRVHPDGRGAVNPLAAAIADLVASAVGPDERRVAPSCDGRARGGAEVQTGLDVLVSERFARLAGAHVGLITNASGVTRDGARDVDALATAPGVSLVAIFAPEHGLGTDQDAPVVDGRDSRTGLPVYSLYGDHFAPTDAELAGIDTLVFNLPDVGARFFTYASTMHRALAAAAKHGLRFVLLDRPDPIDGIHVEGPPLSAARSFVNHAVLPVRHGMTMGELALMLDARDHLGTALEVVRLRGWARESSWGDTGLAWVAPSPNLRSPVEALLYPGIGLLEATNVSVGRGTASPFEVVGAPWIDGARLAAALSRARLAGVRFEPTTFTPATSKLKGALCSGLRFTVTDPAAFAPVSLGVALAVALHALYPSTWDGRGLAPLLGSPEALAAIERGAAEEEVAATWSAALARFLAEREKYLLYPRRACP
jgi:uncharacterized protein YbbC (DUF1343 family)/CubicO group peptidase (beta-lactamase class C family)